MPIVRGTTADEQGRSSSSGLTTKGLRTAVSAAGLRIGREGMIRRFVTDVELVAFNGEAAMRKGQERST